MVCARRGFHGEIRIGRAAERTAKISAAAETGSAAAQSIDKVSEERGLNQK